MTLLSSLFSKPKVERARGYGESTLPVPTRMPPYQTQNLSRPDLLAPTPAPALRNASTSQSRADSSLVSPRNDRNIVSKPSNTQLRIPEAQPPRERKQPPQLEPLPLFQAYPQSTKDGTLEVSTVADDAMSQVSRARTVGFASPIPRSTLTRGFDDGDASPTAAGIGRKGSIAPGELPRKVFVLVTSGYLLQYAESGPSDRLPEKMLRLGKESAAYASDRVVGKHFVLQVSQAVDQYGIAMPTSNSLFSRLRIRASTAKRMTSSFLLVMDTPEQLESWMTAIRLEIETVGGKKMRPDTATRPKTSATNDQMNLLKKTPSASHRYQVKRDPSKISNVSTPISSPTSEMAPPSALPAPKADDGRSESGRSETATIDGIEKEASQLVDEPVPSPMIARPPSDFPSLSPSTAVSVDQKQMNKPQDSGASKTTTSSHVAGANTLTSTAVAASQTNSIPDSSPLEVSANAVAEPSTEQAQTATTFHTVSSFSSSRSGSAIPMSLALSSSTTSPQSTNSPGLESPVMGYQQSSPTNPATNTRLSSVMSEPNLQALAAANARERHDSAMPTPPSLSPVRKPRPDSYIAHLPPLSTRSTHTRLSTGRKHSADAPGSAITMPSPVSSTSPRASAVKRQSILRQSSSPALHTLSSSTSEASRSRRLSSFSLPLKINPSTAENHNSPGLNNRRLSQLSDPDAATENPNGHTLSAKVDSAHGKAYNISSVPTVPPISENPAPESGIIAPARLPLGPRESGATAPQQSSPLPSPVFPTPPSQSPAVGHLKRPNSLLVRADAAPFASYLRGSPSSQSSSSTGRSPSIQSIAAPPPGPAPIRGLRSSRSTSNVPSLLNVTTPAPPSPTGVSYSPLALHPVIPDPDIHPPPLFSAISSPSSPSSGVWAASPPLGQAPLQPTGPASAQSLASEGLAESALPLSTSDARAASASEAPTPAPTGLVSGPRSNPSTIPRAKSLKSRSSIQDIDFSIPLPAPVLAEFGPPPPPPSVPLPMLPPIPSPQSQSQSPAQGQSAAAFHSRLPRSSGGGSGNAVGVAGSNRGLGLWPTSIPNAIPEHAYQGKRKSERHSRKRSKTAHSACSSLHSPRSSSGGVGTPAEISNADRGETGARASEGPNQPGLGNSAATAAARNIEAVHVGLGITV